jgi:transcriptional regulator with XRE-family HTH domain
MSALKDIRIERGLQQKFVAEKCGMFTSNLANYENRSIIPSLQNACKLAEFYGIKTVAELKKLFEI